MDTFFFFSVFLGLVWVGLARFGYTLFKYAMCFSMMADGALGFSALIRPDNGSIHQFTFRLINQISVLFYYWLI